jgi:ficolin
MKRYALVALLAVIALANASESEAESEMELGAGGPELPISCMDAKLRKIKNLKGSSGSGTYVIQPQDGGPRFKVYCDQTTEGGGWTVFQRRKGGKVDFYRPWVDYQRGFGNPNGEHWLGLDKLHRLTKVMPSMLRVELKAFTNDAGGKFGVYRKFMIGDAGSKYRLTVGDFEDHGVGDSLSYHNNRPFSTYDRDNDAWANNCASYFRGAWWYGACHNSNLNGKYYAYPGRHPANYADGADWLTFRGHYESAKVVELKFK